MGDEKQSIHEFDLELICEYYAGLERQGPGSPDVTTKALGFVEGLGAAFHFLRNQASKTKLSPCY